MSETVISIYHVDKDGVVTLEFANIPFTNLQWNRSLSTCGDFAIELVGNVPFQWPGRYLLTRTDRPEVGIVEKVEYQDDESSDNAKISGRFAESLLDRKQFGPDGGQVTGANWRQAVTKAFQTWLMPDAPTIVMGDGTQAISGSSYSIRCDERDTAMGALYAVTSAQDAFPALSLDWELGALELSIQEGVNRTRNQSVNPVFVFSLEMATAQSVSYSGDYSVACSSVFSYASPSSQNASVVTSEVEVPGFDPETMWMSIASEDVSSLCSDSPSASEVASGGRLRAYDHMPALSVDATVLGNGYGTTWDLGDTCEVDVPEAGVSSSARIEEIREVVKKEGATLEVSLGSKVISRISRAMMRLR